MLFGSRAALLIALVFVATLLQAIHAVDPEQGHQIRKTLRWADEEQGRSLENVREFEAEEEMHEWIHLNEGETPVYRRWRFQAIILLRQWLRKVCAIAKSMPPHHYVHKALYAGMHGYCHLNDERINVTFITFIEGMVKFKQNVFHSSSFVSASQDLGFIIQMLQATITAFQRFVVIRTLSIFYTGRSYDHGSYSSLFWSDQITLPSFFPLSDFLQKIVERFHVMASYNPDIYEPPKEVLEQVKYDLISQLDLYEKLLYALVERDAGESMEQARLEFMNQAANLVTADQRDEIFENRNMQKLLFPYACEIITFIRQLVSDQETSSSTNGLEISFNHFVKSIAGEIMFKVHRGQPHDADWLKVQLWPMRKANADLLEFINLYKTAFESNPSQPRTNEIWELIVCHTAVYPFLLFTKVILKQIGNEGWMATPALTDMRIEHGVALKQHLQRMGTMEAFGTTLMANCKLRYEEVY